jgi:hypothetical protein
VRHGSRFAPGTVAPLRVRSHALNSILADRLEKPIIHESACDLSLAEPEDVIQYRHARTWRTPGRALVRLSNERQATFSQHAAVVTSQRIPPHYQVGEPLLGTDFDESRRSVRTPVITAT